MRVFKTLLFVFVLGAAASLLLLFSLQNMDQHIELGLNLGPLGAWRFKEPQPAVFVLLGSFAAGLVIVGLFAVYEVIRFEQRTRRLEATIQELRASQGPTHEESTR